MKFPTRDTADFSPSEEVIEEDYLEFKPIEEVRDITYLGRMQLASQYKDTPEPRIEIESGHFEQELLTLGNENVTPTATIDEERIEREDMLRDLFKSRERANAQYPIMKSNYIEDIIRDMAKKKLIKGTSPSLRLTDKGIKEAKILTRKHRILEAFLKKRFGLDDFAVHNQAHKLEHKVNGSIINRLDKWLGYPIYCPHGKRIPRT